jgi:hypothetical protein
VHTYLRPTQYILASATLPGLIQFSDLYVN